jgi:transcriptional regulator with PAS, ATPase and Fis domain
VAEGRFREDLYFRLNVVQITLPSLMERQEDIPLLIQYFLNRFSHKFAKRLAGIDQAARAVLQTYAYPGNVRELQNIIERAVALAEGDTVTLADLPPDLRELAPTHNGSWPTLEAQEREYIQKVLALTNHQTGVGRNPGNRRRLSAHRGGHLKTTRLHPQQEIGPRRLCGRNPQGRGRGTL